MQEKIIEKIKKLLALSDSSNENEAMAAYSAAQKLMTKHQISLSSLQKEKKPEFQIGRAIFRSHNTSLWKEKLTHVLCEVNGCYWYLENGWTDSGQKEKRYILVGIPETMELVEYLFNSIINQGEYLCKARMPKGGGKAWANEFKHGLIVTVGSRLKAAKQEAVREVVVDNIVGVLPASIEGTQQYTNAIVLLDQQYADVKKWAQEKLNLQSIKRPIWKSKIIPGAHAAGREAGKEINLSRPLKS